MVKSVFDASNKKTRVALPKGIFFKANSKQTWRFGKEYTAAFKKQFGGGK